MGKTRLGGLSPPMPIATAGLGSHSAESPAHNFLLRFKGIGYPKLKSESQSTHPHANGSVGEVLLYFQTLQEFYRKKVGENGNQVSNIKK